MIVRLVPEFQFQNGAIISDTRNDGVFSSVKFQFQNGAIISLLCLPKIQCMDCFNSKMVRL